MLASGDDETLELEVAKILIIKTSTVLIDMPYIAGELAHWPSKSQLASLLRKAGFQVSVGSYSIRLQDCEHIAFQEYGGDLGDPQIEADAESIDDLLRDAKRVSDALTANRIRHRFEIYADDHRLIGYMHYDWPAPDSVTQG